MGGHRRRIPHQMMRFNDHWDPTVVFSALLITGLWPPQGYPSLSHWNESLQRSPMEYHVHLTSSSSIHCGHFFSNSLDGNPLELQPTGQSLPWMTTSSKFLEWSWGVTFYVQGKKASHPLPFIRVESGLRIPEGLVGSKRVCIPDP